MSRTEIITIEHDCTCGVGCRLSGGDILCSKCGKARAVKVQRDPHPSADRIPRLAGWPPWMDSPAPPAEESARRRAEQCGCEDCQARFPDLGPTPVRHATAWEKLAKLSVALICLLLTGCQVVAYQHNDYRREDNHADHGERGGIRPDAGGVRFDGTQPKSEVATAFPGMFGLSPGLSDLAAIAGPGTVVAHSAGATRAVRFAADRGLNLELVDPWPPNIDVPPGVPVVYVVTGRPGRVTVAPGTRLVELTHAGGACPWAWTVGHLYACRWPESVDAASMAAAQARMASVGLSLRYVGVDRGTASQ